MAVTVPSTGQPGDRSISPPLPASSGQPPSAPGTGANPSRCCDTGRLFTDPITGQPVCSCQYEREAISNYQRLASLGGVAGPAGIPLSMYSSPYPEGMAAYFPALGTDQPQFYPNPVSYTNIKIFCLSCESLNNTCYCF